MAQDDNPVATTWKYTIRIHDTVDSQDVMQLPKSLVHQPRVQFSHWHLEKWSSTSQPFVRGVLRCVKPTSHRMVTAMLPDANFKPLRGVFTVSRINSELKPLNRVGDVYSIGSIVSHKRTLDSPCPSCGRSPKRSKVQSSSDSEEDTSSGTIRAFFKSLPPASPPSVKPIDDSQVNSSQL